MAKKSLFKKGFSRFRSKSEPMSEQMVLQITSMADVFTIILVFLLKTLSTGVSSFDPSQALTLPSASGGAQMVEALKIQITANSILVDDGAATTLHDFHIEKMDLELDGTPRSLNAALIASRKNHKSSSTNASSTGEEEAPRTTAVLLADRKAPYATVSAVTMAAAKNGFLDLKLAIVQEE